MNNATRVKRLLELVAEKQADSVMVTNPYNRHYLSGFNGTAGTLIISPQRAILATDLRYTECAAQDAPGWEIRNIAGKPNWLSQLVDELNLRKICFEADDVTVQRHRKITQSLARAKVNPELLPSDGLVSRLRYIKDGDEIAKLERAVAIGDAAFTQTAAAMEVGQTEREIALMFEINARRLGADCLSFPSIVAGGENAAHPHHEPGARKIRNGETIVFDCGVMHAGYCSDLTRTIVLGEVDAKIAKVYNTVLKAQETAIKAIRPGMPGREADEIARQVIEKAGYGKQFLHGLGHGVGLEIHEEPYLAQSRDLPLEVGSVITIEPGIYIAGWGGVRIEDMAVVEQNGARVISNAPKMNLNK